MKWSIVTLISFFLCFTAYRMISWDDQGNLIAHSYSVWGDWSAHFTFISAIRERGVSWILNDNPLFYGVPFQYPFLSHCITALFGYLTGLDTIGATLWSTLILLAVFPFVLLSFFRTIGLTDRQSILSILLFVFMGGFQFLDSSLSSNDALTNQFQQGSVVTQFILFELIPQRAFLFGMIILISCLTYLIKWFSIRRTSVTSLLSRSKSSPSSPSSLTSPSSPSSLSSSLTSSLSTASSPSDSSNNDIRINSDAHSIWGIIICISLLSLLVWTHLHSWIAMGITLAVFFGFALSNRKKQKISPIKIFGIGILILGISAPLIYFLLFRNKLSAPSKPTWSIWAPGWAIHQSANIPGAQEMSFARFWIYNTGLFIPLFLFGLITLFQLGKHKVQSTETILMLSTSGIVLFTLASLFQFQPYFYDNLKLYTYALLFLSPVASVGLDWFFQGFSNSAHTTNPARIKNRAFSESSVNTKHSSISIMGMPNKKSYILPIIGFIIFSIQSMTAVKDFQFFLTQKQQATFFSKEEIDLSKKFNEVRKSPNSLVLISPRHNHWLTALSGNPVFLGYQGWLWSWGINYSQREKEAAAILLATPWAETVLSNLPIEYIVVHENDQIAGKPVSISRLKDKFNTIIESGKWYVFSASLKN